MSGKEQEVEEEFTVEKIIDKRVRNGQVSKTLEILCN